MIFDTIENINLSHNSFLTIFDSANICFFAQNLIVYVHLDFRITLHVNCVKTKKTYFTSPSSHVLFLP